MKNFRSVRQFVALLIIPGSLSISQSVFANETGPAQRPTTQPPPMSPGKLPPHPLSDVAAIIEADVAKISYAFDKRLGPRTVIELANAIVHAGATPPSMTFSQLGGPLPDGGFLEVVELPRFTLGARYVLFFGKQASVYTAVWARLAFRLENLAGRSIALGPDGTPVRYFGFDGVQFGRTRLLSAEPDSSKQTYAETFLRNVAQTDADTATAISSNDLLSSAIKVASEVDAPIGDPVSLDPEPFAQWDVIPTSPQ